MKNEMRSEYVMIFEIFFRKMGGFCFGIEIVAGILNAVTYMVLQ